MLKSKPTTKQRRMNDKQLAERALKVLARGKGSLHDGKVYTTYDVEEGVGCGHGKLGDPLLRQMHDLALERPARLVSTSYRDDGYRWPYPGYCWAMPGTKGVVVEDHAERMAEESAKHKPR
jgi:hypothetical protein